MNKYRIFLTAMFVSVTSFTYGADTNNDGIADDFNRDGVADNQMARGTQSPIAGQGNEGMPGVSNEQKAQRLERWAKDLRAEAQSPGITPKKAYKLNKKAAKLEKNAEKLRHIDQLQHQNPGMSKKEAKKQWKMHKYQQGNTPFN